MPAAGLSVSVYDSAFSLCGVWNSLHAVSNDFFMLIHLTFNLKYSMHCNKRLLLCVCVCVLIVISVVCVANRFVGVLITSILLRWCVLMCRPVNNITYLYLSCFSLTELKKPKSSAMTCYRWLLPSIHLRCLHWTSFAVFWKMSHQCFMKGSLKHFI